MTFKAFCATICFTALSLAGCNDPVRISVPPLVLSIVPDTPTLAVGQTREYRITLVSGMLGLEDRVVDWSIRDTLIATRTTSTDTSVMIRGRSLGTTLLIARSRIRGSADTLELVVHPDTVRPPGVLVPWSTLQGQLAYSVEDSLFVLDPVKRERRLIARAAASTTLSPVSWSPDGVRLAAVVFGAGTATQTRIFDARDGTQVQALDGARCPSWTRDGRLS